MPRRVLIIDDEPDLALALTARLRGAGYEVDRAPDGPTGLRLATNWRPHVVLLDLRMPGMDGLEVLRRMRDSTDLSRVPVIMLSAHATAPVRREAVAAGAACFLSKPYNAPDLLAAIEDVIEPVSATHPSSGGHEQEGAP